MSAVQKLSVALTGEQVGAMKAAVETGEYATTSEIVREALREWQQKREMREAEIQRLQQLLDEGETSGPPREYDMARIIASAKSRKWASRSLTSSMVDGLVTPIG